MIRPPRLFAEVCAATLLAIALGYGAGWGLAAMLGGQSPHYAGVGVGCYTGVLMLTIGMALYLRVIEVDTKAWHAPRDISVRRLEVATPTVGAMLPDCIKPAQVAALRRAAVRGERGLAYSRWVNTKVFGKVEFQQVLVVLRAMGFATLAGNTVVLTDAGVRALIGSPTPPEND